MEVALAQEKIWFDKYKYEEAERIYFESIAKLLVCDGFSHKTVESSQLNGPCSPISFPLKDKFPVSDSTTYDATSESLIEDPVPDPITYITTSEPRIEDFIPNPITYVNSSEPRIEDKRFKVKTRNKYKKDSEKKVEKPAKHEIKVSSNNAILKNSLAEEVAKARQHIKSSLECVDGIAKLTSDSHTVEIISKRLNTLESDTVNIRNDVKDLLEIIKQLNKRIETLEKSKSTATPPAAKPAVAVPSPSQKPPASKPKVEEDDDGVDLFGSDSEEEDEEAKKVKEQRLAEYAAKKSKKPALIAKSNIILDVKPWDDETDMKKMEEEVRKVTIDGLIWGASKLVPLAYGIHKLQISCVVEDDKVSVDWLQEQLEAIEDFVQSVDIAAFNKV